MRFNYNLSFSCIGSSVRSEEDIYFTLKMSNISTSKTVKKLPFRKNLATYLLSTTSIISIVKVAQSLTKQNSNEAKNHRYDPNQFSFSEATDIPQHLLKIAESDTHLAM